MPDDRRRMTGGQPKKRSRQQKSPPPLSSASGKRRFENRVDARGGTRDEAAAKPSSVSAAERA